MKRRLLGWMIVFTATVLMLSGCCQTPDYNALYVCFGDSITKGKDSPSYPEVLAGYLGLSTNEVANEGESGESAHKGADRIQDIFGNCDAYPNAGSLLYMQGAAGLIDWIQETDPLLLFDPWNAGYPYLAQLNERLGNIKNNIIAAVQTAQNNVDRIYVATYYDLVPGVFPCEMNPTGLPLSQNQAEKINHYVALLNGKIEEAASETGSILVDVNTAVGDWSGTACGEAPNDPRDCFFDCNHPSGSGNQVIAEVFYDSITAP